MAYSPNGKFIASVGDDVTWIWNAETGKKVRVFTYNFVSTGHCVKWSNDSNFIAISFKNYYDDGELKIWNINTGELVRNYPYIENSFCWKNDGTEIAGICGNKIHIFSFTPNNTDITDIIIDNAFEDISLPCFSPDEKYIAGVDCNCSIKIIEVSTGKEIFRLKGHTSKIASLQWSPNGIYILSASKDKTIRIWDTRTGEIVQIISTDMNTESECDDVYWLNDENQIVALSDNGIQIWDVKSENIIYTGKIKDYFHGQIQWSPDSKKYALISDENIQVFDLDTNKELFSLQSVCEKYNPCVQFSKDSKHLISMGEDKNLRIWDSSTGSLEQHIKVDYYIWKRYCILPISTGFSIVYESNDWKSETKRTTIHFDGTIETENILTGIKRRNFDDEFRCISPNGNYLACDDGVFSITDNRKIIVFEKKDSNEDFFSWSEDGKYVKFGQHIWNATDGKIADDSQMIMEKKSVHQDEKYSPDGRYILEYVENENTKTTTLKDCKTGAVVKKWDNFYHGKWSPNSKYIAYISDISQETPSFKGILLHIYSVDNNKEICNDAYGWDIEWSPNSEYISVGNAYIIDAKTCSLIREIDDYYNKISWSPDNEHFYNHHLLNGIIEIQSVHSDSVFIANSENEIVSLSPDGTKIASKYYNGNIRISELNKAEKMRTINDYIDDICAWNADNTSFVTVGNDIKIWEAATGKIIHYKDFHENCDINHNIRLVSWSPNGKYILILYQVDESQFSIYHLFIFDVQNNSIYKLNETCSETPTLYWSKNSKYLKIYSRVEALIYDVEEKELYNLDITNEKSVIAFLPNTAQCIIYNNKHSIELYDMFTGKLVKNIFSSDEEFHFYNDCSSYLSPDGTKLAIFSDKHSFIMSTANGQKIKQAPSDAGEMKWISNNEIVFDSRYEDKKLAIWNIDSDEIKEIPLSSLYDISIVQCANKKYLLQENKYNYKSPALFLLYDIESGDCTTFRSEQLSISPNGNYAIQSIGNALVMWDLKSKEILYTIINNKDGEYLTYTPEGFFCGTEWACKNLVYIVDGLEITELDQVYDKLYRPDLIAAKARGEDVSEEAAKVDLAALLKTGKAPVVSFKNASAVSEKRDYEFEFSVKDCGGGIGA